MRRRPEHKPEKIISEIYRRLFLARELMDDCYDQPLDIERLAEEACISPYHFIRLFKQTFATTPHQYLIMWTCY